MSQSAKSALDAEAGRAAVAATEAARRCAEVEKKANRAAARFAEASGRQSRDTFSEDGAVMTPLATDDRRALDAARDASRLSQGGAASGARLQRMPGTKSRAARRLADDARQLQEEEPPPIPFDLGMQQPVASDSDGEFPEEAASPGMRKARRRIGRQKEEIHALRRLVCGGWMAQWRMLCELGEDPVPAVDDDPSTPSRESLEDEEDYELEFSGGARVDPAALAGRFAADISALDAATAQLAGGAAPDAEAAPYASALAETLLQMERASGCLRALAAIEVAPWTPAQLREQLDAAYGRLEDMSSRRGSITRRATPTRRPANGTNSDVVGERAELRRVRPPRQTCAADEAGSSGNTRPSNTPLPPPPPLAARGERANGVGAAPPVRPAAALIRSHRPVFGHDDRLIDAVDLGAERGCRRATSTGPATGSPGTGDGRACLRLRHRGESRRKYTWAPEPADFGGARRPNPGRRVSGTWSAPPWRPRLSKRSSAKPALVVVAYVIERTRARRPRRRRPGSAASSSVERVEVIAVLRSRQRAPIPCAIHAPCEGSSTRRHTHCCCCCWQFWALRSARVLKRSPLGGQWRYARRKMENGTRGAWM